MSMPLADATACCGCGRRKVALALGVLLVVAVAGWAIATAMRNSSTAAIPETAERVEIWVAAKDLPVGTILTKAELNKLAVKKSLVKDNLPAAFVVNEDDLINRRVVRSLLKDEAFNTGNVRRSSLMLREGEDLISLPMSVAQADRWFAVPGSKVDVLATMRLDGRLRSFPILVDMLVIAMDTIDKEPWPVNGPSRHMVFFSATQRQALVLALAKQLGCHLEVLLRHPGMTGSCDYNIDRILEILQEKGEVEERMSVAPAPVKPEEIPAPRRKDDGR